MAKPILIIASALLFSLVAMFAAYLQGEDTVFFTFWGGAGGFAIGLIAAKYSS